MLTFWPLYVVVPPPQPLKRLFSGPVPCRRAKPKAMPTVRLANWSM
jgi:hypothetical protein